MHGTTSSGFSTELRSFYDKVLLDRLLPRLLHTQFGTKRSVPSNWGRSILFRKFEKITATTTALTEGTAGTEAAFSISSLNATLNQYGRRLLALLGCRWPVRV
jgi:N4-gp56 family major capsid protein